MHYKIPELQVGIEKALSYRIRLPVISVQREVQVGNDQEMERSETRKDMTQSVISIDPITKKMLQLLFYRAENVLRPLPHLFQPPLIFSYG